MAFQTSRDCTVLYSQTMSAKRTYEEFSNIIAYPPGKKPQIEEQRSNTWTSNDDQLEEIWAQAANLWAQRPPQGSRSPTIASGNEEQPVEKLANLKLLNGHGPSNISQSPNFTCDDEDQLSKEWAQAAELWAQSPLQASKAPALFTTNDDDDDDDDQLEKTWAQAADLWKSTRAPSDHLSNQHLRTTISFGNEQLQTEETWRNGGPSDVLFGSRYYEIEDDGLSEGWNQASEEWDEGLEEIKEIEDTVWK